ncbi:MAG: hypothetical protein P8L85_22065 [Rubripirellula sp.]|nr:hypothetical protein [Rubripirellula sp.]
MTRKSAVGKQNGPSVPTPPDPTKSMQTGELRPHGENIGPQRRLWENSLLPIKRDHQLESSTPFCQSLTRSCSECGDFSRPPHPIQNTANPATATATTDHPARETKEAALVIMLGRHAALVIMLGRHAAQG